MADGYLILLNSALKEHLLAMDGRGKKRLREKLEFLENGLWDTGVRVKKLRGVSGKVVFEARLSRAERIIFTLGRQAGRTAVYVWGIAGHDEVSAAARSVLPANAPFLAFEPADTRELPEMLLEELDPEVYTQENLEERTPSDYGPQKWLVLTDRQWDRLLRASPGDSLELFLHLTAEQSRVLDLDPPLLLSGTAGSGKTTLAVYYLLRKELLDRRRAFITCSPHLKRFSERIYDGLTRHASLEEGTRPEFHVFRDLLFDLLGSAGKSVDPAGEVGLAEFTRIFSDMPQARSYDPELVWEEIRAIIKGAKPPVSLNRYRRLLKGWESGGLSELELAELKDFLLWLKNFELIEKIERFVEKRGRASSYDAFVAGLGRGPGKGDPAAGGNPAGKASGGGQPGGEGTGAVLREILRIAEKKAAGFASPLLSLREYRMLGRKRAPNFLYDREEIHAIARYYQERLESEGRYDEIDLTRRALAALQAGGPGDGRAGGPGDGRAGAGSPGDGRPGTGGFVYDFVACDEVQDLADVQLSLVFRLARSCRGLLLAGDTRQIINPSGFRWEEVKARFYERGVEVPEVVHLNLNFRCVGNVVRLANALLELKQRLVGVSGSELREEWKFSGKPPVLIQGLGEKEVLDRAGITGAGQVFLVRSAAEADRLKKALDTELVFTLQEAKGLEFDTVFLWKFARDPKASAVWRRIKDGHPFDRAHHPHIRHEINLLYVAVTRARNTLVVYDGPRAADVWKVGELEGLLFRTDRAGELDQAWRRVSTPAEWEEQGDYFFERERWRAAAECYRNAGNAVREEEARAFVLEREGEHAAAGRLLEKHGHPARAAACFERAGEPERALALWERLGEEERARRCRAGLHESRGEYEEAAAELEKLGDLEGALRCWERAGNHLEAARRHLAAGRVREAALGFEKAGAVDEACRCYRKLKKPGKAAELYFRSGAYEKAAALYKKLKNTDMLARCWEKTGDYYQLALLHQKAKRIDEAVSCFARHAAESEENRQQLLAEAQRLDGGRTALKAALRFSALGLYERSAPVFFKKGYLDAALRDYERAGDHEGAATCHHARGEY
ncbi:MAG: 3'-5' exonuclease, partial [Spirochaetota bacterium]